jgi:hypothetical protein
MNERYIIDEHSNTECDCEIHMKREKRRIEEIEFTSRNEPWEVCSRAPVAF